MMTSDTCSSAKPRHLALFLSALRGGGAQRRVLTLARGFAARGHRVDVVFVGQDETETDRRVQLVALNPIPARLPVLRRSKGLRVLAAAPALATYLRRVRPDVVLSTSSPANLAALWARRLAGSNVPVVVTVNVHFSESTGPRQASWGRLLRFLLRRAYPAADAAIAISRGVAADLARSTAIAAERIVTIYNPVDLAEIERRAAEKVDHPWLAKGEPPVVLAVGKLKRQKDFPTLLRAFRLVHEARPAHLVILGEGEERPRLEKLARRLGVSNDFALPGFADNPFAWMARASVLVLSSAWEGLSNVLLEALACGCPVVSTDCPSGPAEILENGAYGPLVPVGDAGALAKAIQAVLDSPPDRERLRARAQGFSVDAAVDRYLDVLLSTRHLDSMTPTTRCVTAENSVAPIPCAANVVPANETVDEAEDTLRSAQRGFMPTTQRISARKLVPPFEGGTTGGYNLAPTPSFVRDCRFSESSRARARARNRYRESRTRISKDFEDEYEHEHEHRSAEQEHEKIDTPVRRGNLRAAHRSTAITAQGEGSVVPRKIALLVRSLSGGGMERIVTTLANGFAERGHGATILTGLAAGDMRREIAANVRLVPLPASSHLAARLLLLRTDPSAAFLLNPFLLGPSPRMVRHLSALARLLAEERVDAVLSAGTQSNLVALWARRFPGVRSRIVISERNTMSSVVEHAKRGFRRRYPALARRAYGGANAIIAVSDGVAEDLCGLTGMARERVVTIRNPVVSGAMLRKAQAPVEHRWLADPDVPVILAVGRLHRQKDFPTLIRAFARVRAARPARLVILGEGVERAKIESLAQSLGVRNDVDLPGYTDNPFAWMAKASVFVLSSAWEGVGNVLVEAMACGCPVVSTDCPSGPAEILDGGAFGALVPVGDDAAMASAILRTLETPTGAERLRARASLFDRDASIDRYLEVLLESLP